MRLSSDDIGQIGQSAFAGWMAQVGAIANPSQRDAKGWDYLVQFSDAYSPSEHRGPLDRAPPEIACMVQVKTSATDSVSWPIKLSNWRRMVSDPIPWFVLVVHLSESHEPALAYFVHIDDAWCAKVLARLRALEDATLETLHRHTLDLTCEASDCVKPATGRAIIDRIRDAVRSGQHAYVEHKIESYNTLGYDGTPRDFSISMRVERDQDFWRATAELGIGLRKTFPGYVGAKLFETRFGVRRSVQNLQPEDGEVEFAAPSVASATLELSEVDATGGVRHDCEVYRAASIIPFLPPEYDRIRFASKHMSLVLPFVPQASGVHPSLTFQFPDNETTSLSALSNVLETIALINASSTTPLLLRLSAEGSGGPAFTTRMCRPELPAELLKWHQDLTTAVHVLKAFEGDSEIVLSVDQLAMQIETLRFLEVAFGSSALPLQLGIVAEVAVGEMVGAISEAALHLPNDVLYACIGAFGRITEVDEGPMGKLVRIAEGRCITDRTIVSRCDADTFDQDSHRELMKARLTAEGCQFIRRVKQEN